VYARTYASSCSVGEVVALIRVCDVEV
jgi:hypothetical protein